MMARSVQKLAAQIEWRRMADQDTYYPLRDGPRRQVGKTALHTMARYLPSEQLALGWRCAALHARLHSAHGRGKGEVAERVQGGSSEATRDLRMREMGECIRELAVLEVAACRVGTDGEGVYRAICLGWTQAHTMRVIEYPPGSKGSFRRLFQTTLEAMQLAHDRQAKRDANRGVGKDGLDIETLNALTLVA